MVQAANNGNSAPIAGRGGTSPIGTTNQNSGGTAATNSSYGVGVFTSGINFLDPSVTTYQLNNTDYQGIVLFNTASAVTVTLNGAVQDNFSCDILNLGTGAVTFTPNLGLTVNGASSVTGASGQGSTVYFANRAWVAFLGTTALPVTPASAGPTTHEWINSYNATTGVFTLTQPAFSDISGTLVPAQLPTVGLTVVVTTAALTLGGTQGSMTFTKGIITAQVQAT